MSRIDQYGTGVFKINAIMLEYTRCFTENLTEDLDHHIEKIVNVQYHTTKRKKTYNISHDLWYTFQDYINFEKVKMGTLIDQINREIYRQLIIKRLKVNTFNHKPKNTPIKSCKINDLLFRKIEIALTPYIKANPTLTYEDIFEEYALIYLDNYTMPTKTPFAYTTKHGAKLLETASAEHVPMDYLISLAMLELTRTQLLRKGITILEMEAIRGKQNSCISKKLWLECPIKNTNYLIEEEMGIYTPPLRGGSE